MLRLVSRAAVACPRAPLGRALSAGSHSDFEPKLRTSGSADAAEIIREQVTQNKVMLYMKGTPASPMCGFSSQVIRILDVTGAEFESVNVLEHPNIREGIKKYSDWPTIPQLYVDGEFVGGCDIVTDMFQSGELMDILQEKKADS